MSLCWQWDHGETEWVLRIGLCRCLLISWTQSGKILVCASAGNGRHCVGANGVALFLTPVSVRLCLRVYVSHSLSPLCGACALLIRRCRPVIDSTRVRPFNAYIIRNSAPSGHCVCTVFFRRVEVFFGMLRLWVIVRWKWVRVLFSCTIPFQSVTRSKLIYSAPYVASESEISFQTSHHTRATFSRLFRPIIFFLADAISSSILNDQRHVT